jgi:branched-chain amino acid transport system permease protein
MDGTIFVLLLQDGLTTGAIYLLLAIGLLIVFAVTRVIFIPQGDFVAYGALSMASMLAGRIPGTLWLLDTLALVNAVLALRQKKPIHGLLWALLPAALVTIAVLVSVKLGAWPWLLGALSIAITALLGPPIYRLTFSLLAGASVLTLLIVAMALHYVLLGIGLIIFGPEASTTPPFSAATYTLDGIDISGHSLWVAASCVALVVALRWLFRFTNAGRAMRATASNPLGARLMGIDAGASARKAFLLACAIGALGGLLIAPLTPISYDSGFLMGLKGFIAAVIGGLASYPIAAAGALCVGVIESLSSFWASSYSNPIVFGLLIPALAILSLRPGTIED